MNPVSSLRGQPLPYPDDLAYLQDELQWIEARCRRLHDEELSKESLSADPPSPRRRRGGEVDLDPRLLAIQSKEGRKREHHLRTMIDARRQATADRGQPTALDRLVALHGLDPFERMLVLLAAAPAFSRSFEKYYGMVSGRSDGMGWNDATLTVEIAFRFAELPFADRIRKRATFAKNARLFANDILVYEQLGRFSAPEDLLNADLRLGGRTFAYLVGDNAMSAELLEFSAIESPLSTLDAVVIDPQDKQRILAVVEKHAEYLQRRKEWGFDDVIRYGRGILMLFWGTPGTGKTMTAHGVAHALGKRILNVDIPAFINLRDGDRFLSALFREARLQNAVLFFDECEGLLSSRNAGNSLMNVLLTEIERFEGVAILATNLAHQLDPALERRILVKVAFPEPDREMRAEIWRKHLPARAPIAPDVDVEALATRYELSGGYIKNAVLTALANVVHQGGSPPEIAMRHLETAAQAQLQRWGEGSAKRSFPKARLADVVLPPSVAERVHEVVDAARNHSLVVDRWALGAHFSHGKGISAMFTGAPGTGKTLCAEAIAGELGRPLVSASVPSLLSKWVGESEKNISALFAEAAAAGAVLFFDEADALLSARGRTNASRHDDSIVDVMLVGIERFRGLVLLATNLAGKLDPALARRIGWTLEFPMPGSAERAAIWAGMLPVTVPLKGRVDFAHLGREYRLSGGQIKNAVMRAAFRAARLGVALDHGQLCKAAAEEAGVVVSAGVVEC